MWEGWGLLFPELGSVFRQTQIFFSGLSPRSKWASGSSVSNLFFSSWDGSQLSEAEMAPWHLAYSLGPTTVQLSVCLWNDFCSLIAKVKFPVIWPTKKSLDSKHLIFLAISAQILLHRFPNPPCVAIIWSELIQLNGCLLVFYIKLQHVPVHFSTNATHTVGRELIDANLIQVRASNFFVQVKLIFTVQCCYLLYV